MQEILAETEKRGITFDQLLTIPEKDEWVYSDGKSTTCVAFILYMYKEAGLFGPFSNSIQVTEFTVSRHGKNLDNSELSFQPMSESDMALFNILCRFVMLICLSFLRTTIRVCQVGATLRMDESLSARSLVNIVWNCLNITLFSHMLT